MTWPPPLLAEQRDRVTVAHGRGPYANTRAALEPLDLAALAGKRVLLKPNVGRCAAPGTAVNTHPEVVAAIIDHLRDVGAEVAVGESPITGVDVAEAFERSGLTTVTGRRNCPLIDLDRRPYVEVPVPEGRVLERLQVCADVLEVDAVVSIPVMKTHMHTAVTLAVKNMKGCLWRRSKVALHMLPPLPDSDDKPLHVAIADLAGVLRPHLSVIDGTWAMEGLGPSAGAARRLDTVVAGVDAFAADAVACCLMGCAAADVPYLRLGAARGLGCIDLETLRIEPDGWRDWITPLAGPPENLEIQFPGVVVRDRQSCSACQSTLLLFLQQYRDILFDYVPPEQRPVHVAIGRGHEHLPERTLCLGNCTANQKHRGLFVPGCPPVASEILRALTGKPTAEPPQHDTDTE